jgi:hypothetical protein
MPDRNPRDRPARRPKGFKTEQGTCESFSCSMVLFHNISEIFCLADHNGRLVCPVVVGNRRSVTPTLINRDLFRKSMSANGLAETGLGRIPITSGRQQKINREALLVHGAIALPQFPTLARKDGASQFMLIFSALELGQGAPTFGVLIKVGETVDRLCKASEFSHCLCQYWSDDH